MVNFFMVGNGGYLGMFFDQSYGLVRGYATASTNTGHNGPDPRFAYNNRAAEIDFAFRAVHLTVLAAKRLIKTFYGTGTAVFILPWLFDRRPSGPDGSTAISRRF